MDVVRRSLPSRREHQGATPVALCACLMAAPGVWRGRLQCKHLSRRLRYVRAESASRELSAATSGIGAPHPGRPAPPTTGGPRRAPASRPSFRASQRARPAKPLRRHLEDDKGLPVPGARERAPRRASGARTRHRGRSPRARPEDLLVNVPSYGKVVVDIAYGGAFYAFLSAEKLGLDVCSAKTRDLVDAASAVTEAVKTQFKIHHPDSEDLAFLYGTILTDGKDAYSEEPTTNICVFADEQVDRSPTGSGVTARIALQYHKGLLELNQARAFKSSATGSVFTGKAVREAKCGDFKAVILEVSGQAHYTGTASFVVEDDDPLKDGFLLK
ncbi:trans-3-hydroxy-L-proline dehydratase-like [Talpa occidentalis]|uniref:trans-3-hydroxy-L-proline dehydratase-like n=1 Tax=Talpa occidentalis TaxID=50954 RepID=UPI00188F017C|nr:trans-3-hydroxy-L-proline dehydratase-like [Talpa occidentalis]